MELQKRRQSCPKCGHKLDGGAGSRLFLQRSSRSGYEEYVLARCPACQWWWYEAPFDSARTSTPTVGVHHARPMPLSSTGGASGLRIRGEAASLKGEAYKRGIVHGTQGAEEDAETPKRGA